MTELMALRFLSLNINSYVCLRFRCFESGKGTDGGRKTDSNCVLISYAQSMYSLSLCLFLFSVSLSVSQALLPPDRTNSVSFSSSYRKLFSLLFFFSPSLLLSPFPHCLILYVCIVSIDVKKIKRKRKERVSERGETEVRAF